MLTKPINMDLFLANSSDFWKVHFQTKCTLINFNWETEKHRKGSYLKKHSHGCNDPLLPERSTEAVEVIGVVHVDLHLWETETLGYTWGHIPSLKIIKPYITVCCQEWMHSLKINYCFIDTSYLQNTIDIKALLYIEYSILYINFSWIYSCNKRSMGEIEKGHCMFR